MSVTVKEFLEVAQDGMSVETLSGEKYLKRVIKEKAINRPGLALAGHYKYFAQNRIQVLGLAELTYLKELKEKDAEQKVEEFFGKHIPCVVISRNRKIPEYFINIAEKTHTPVLKVNTITSDFINAATMIMEELTAPTKRVHGTVVDIRGVGVLIQGDAGIGKSETALALVERGHSLVADDLTILERNGRNKISCTSSEITRYHMEIRGLGIIHVPSLFGMGSVRRTKGLDLIVDLYKPSSGIADERSGLDKSTKEIFDVEIPYLGVPVTAGRDVANVIEVAAMNQRLIHLGHDAAKELNEKIIKMLMKKNKPK